MIAAPVQCDVHGIPKGSHSVSVRRARLDWSVLINSHGRPVVSTGMDLTYHQWTIIEPLFEEKRRPDGRGRPGRDAAKGHRHQRVAAPGRACDVRREEVDRVGS